GDDEPDLTSPVHEAAPQGVDRDRHMLADHGPSRPAVHESHAAAAEAADDPHAGEDPDPLTYSHPTRATKAAGALRGCTFSSAVSMALVKPPWSLSTQESAIDVPASAAQLHGCSLIDV